MKKIIVLFIVAFIFCGAYAQAQEASVVRVAVVRGASRVTLEVESPYEVRALQTDELLFKENGLKDAVALPLNSGVEINNRKLLIYAAKIVPANGATIVVNKRAFRGQMDVIREKDMTLTLVNHVNIEDYIKGVLYREVSDVWPLDAIKAQAVVSRTFALYMARINASRDYDVTNDIYSQMYGGKTSEKYMTSLAVDLTEGQVLTYNGALFPAYFHSACGGHTEDVSVLWKDDIAPLKGKVCEFCKGTKHYRWKERLSAREISDTLKKNNFRVGTVKDIAVMSRDASGRIMNLDIRGSSAGVCVSAKDFRQMFDPKIIRSTNFTVEAKGGYVYFSGFGWGHGVGLCQWGAYSMAEQGYPYDKIVLYYYPGAKLKTLGAE